MSTPSDILVEMVVKLVSAKQETEATEQQVTKGREAVRRALEVLEARIRRIVDEGDAQPEIGYQIAFLDDGLRDIEEADRRYGVDFVQRTGARRREDLLDEVVTALKGESER